MLFPPLTEGRILKRYKRFFADIELSDGSVVVAHVPNTGSMKTCWEEGWKALVSPATNPERKLRWTLEFTFSNDHFIMVNTSRTNALVEESLKNKLLTPFDAYGKIEAEQKILDSRFDFKLTQAGLPDCWIEVKNVTLLDSPRLASFPDAVTSRGLKHLNDLIKLKEMGHRVGMLYVLSRSDCESFKIADEIDPAYAAGVMDAKKAGVEFYCYRLEQDMEHFKLKTPIPFKGQSET
jgi:sugar fermentation stimulation protein A